MAYESFCASVRGKSHIQKGTPREDFGIKMDHDDCQIFVVADGHGDPNCPRSQMGAQYVCEIAAENLRVFAQTIREQGWEDRLLDEAKAPELVQRLIYSIVGEWIHTVTTEWEQKPLTEKELQDAAAYAKEYTAGIGVERMYGTTLIAGVRTEKYLLLLQQGDGRCVVFDSRGNASQPIPWDDRCVGNATTSLCDMDAAQSCRYHIVDLAKEPVIACIAGTDGVEDSFPMSMEQTHAYYRELLRYACENGVPKLEVFLIDELNELSEKGSADDITVSGIVDVARVQPFLDTFAAQNRRIQLEDEVTQLQERVRSIEEGGKWQHVKQRYEEALAAFEQAAQRYQEVADSCEALAKTITAQEQGIPEWPTELHRFRDMLTELIKRLLLPRAVLDSIKKTYEQLCTERDTAEETLRRATAQKDAAEKAYLPMKERYDSFVQKRDEAIGRLHACKGS